MKILFGRKASVTLEFVLATTLATIVLIMVIGLFNNSMATVANSRINNLFNNNSSRTHYTSYGRDYAHVVPPPTPPKSTPEALVLTIATDGKTLKEIHNQAVAIITGLKDKPQNQLSTKELLALAMAMTVYMNSTEGGRIDDTYMKLGSIQVLVGGTTTIGPLDDKIVNWHGNSNIGGTKPDNKDAEKIYNIKAIIAMF